MSGLGERLRALDRRFAPAKTPSHRDQGRMALAGLLGLVVMAAVAARTPVALSGAGGFAALVLIGGRPWIADEVRDRPDGGRVRAVAAAACLVLFLGLFGIPLADRDETPSEQECRDARAVLLTGALDEEALAVANACPQAG